MSNVLVFEGVTEEGLIGNLEYLKYHLANERREEMYQTYVQKLEPWKYYMCN
jgi:hypothetical protein